MYLSYRMVNENSSFQFHSPERGEVVVAEIPNMEARLIKRVVAIPGEMIAVHDGHTYIKG